MPRKVRVLVPDCPHHIVQRANPTTRDKLDIDNGYLVLGLSEPERLEIYRQCALAGSANGKCAVRRRSRNSHRHSHRNAREGSPKDAREIDASP